VGAALWHVRSDMLLLTGDGFSWTQADRSPWMPAATSGHGAVVSKMNASGALMDSLSAYFQRSLGLAAIGLVGVGEA
jgi:hypothetical protein